MEQQQNRLTLEMADLVQQLQTQCDEDNKEKERNMVTMDETSRRICLTEYFSYFTPMS